jgi:hypothetical protein
MTFVFTWHRCDPAGSACVHIAGGTGPTHVVSSTDVEHTLRVGVTATNPFGRGFARSAPTPVIVAVQRTLTLTSRPRSVVYGRNVQLLGNVSPGQAGVSVMIQAQQFGTAGSRRVATVSTASDGSFIAIVKPRIRTVYLAKLADRTTSAPVAVGVRPHLQLASTGKHLFSLTVYAARSFVGKLALVQRWSTTRHAWQTMGRIHLRTARYGPTTRTSKLFLLRVGHGLTLRVRMPLNQAKTGYLPGVSNTIRS